MTSLTTTAVDPAPIAFLRRCGGEDLLRRVVNTFIDDAPQRLARAHAAAAAGDGAAVAAVFHSLLSSAGQLGALRLRGLCGRGEHLARVADEAALASMVREVECELLSAIVELRQMVDDLSI